MASSSLYVSVPLKKTWEVDLATPLRTFIADTYGNTCNPDDYNSALTEFNKLRNTVIAKSVDRHESTLDILYRYYDQLVAIEGKLPISENQIRISFKWQDAFDKESLFAGKRTLSIASGTYERVCILFNIASLQSQIAEAQNLASDDGLKMAAKLFQQSSGIYSYLQSIVLSSVQGDPTPDLHPDTLAAISALMLAQGQDCFVRKAMSDKMKPAVTAKLSFQCSELYVDAMKLLQLETLRNLWPKDWIMNASGKQAAFHGIAEYYQSLVSKEAKDFGEEIARLRHAKDLLSAAETKGGTSFVFYDVQKKVMSGLQETEKDNDFIYHARIPEITTLQAIGKAAVAKSTPLSTPMSSQFKDLFERVVPLAVHEALKSYESRKSEILNNEVGRMREATQLLNSVLVSLNLPAAIEDLSGGPVPKSVLEKSAMVKQLGGYDCIVQLTNNLPSLLQRNKEILDESEKLLNEEAQTDQQLRGQFKERWTRTPSERLTETIRGELSKYRNIVNNAVHADGIVRDKFNVHREGMELLSQPDSEIEKNLPSAGPTNSMDDLPSVGELKKLLAEVEELRKDRDQLETELKEGDSTDMTSKFLASLSRDGAIDEESLSANHLDDIFSSLRESVSANIHRQERILEQIQHSNNEFSEVKAQNKMGVTREEKLKSLALAYDVFIELKGNLEEGTKFYNDLTQLLVKFQSKVSDFCFARRTEKDELMKDLSASIARQAGAPHPATPAYQQPTVQSTAPVAPSVASHQPPPMSYNTPGYNTGPAAAAPYQIPSYSNVPSQMPMPMPYNPYTNWSQQAPAGYPQAPAGYSQAPAGYPQQASAGYPQQASAGYPQQAPAGYPQQAPVGYPQQGPAGYQQYPQQAPAGYSQQPAGYPPQQRPQYPGYPGYPPQQYPGYPSGSYQPR